MRAGYNDSLEMMQELGDASLNSYKTFIKFYCSDKPLEKLKQGTLLDNVAELCLKRRITSFNHSLLLILRNREVFFY